MGPASNYTSKDWSWTVCSVNKVVCDHSYPLLRLLLWKQEHRSYLYSGCYYGSKNIIPILYSAVTMETRIHSYPLLRLLLWKQEYHFYSLHRLLLWKQEYYSYPLPGCYYGNKNIIPTPYSGCYYGNKNIIPILYSGCYYGNKNIIPILYSGCYYGNKNIIPIFYSGYYCYTCRLLSAKTGQYCIAGNFRGRKLSQIGENMIFAEKTFTDWLLSQRQSTPRPKFRRENFYV